MCMIIDANRLGVFLADQMAELAGFLFPSRTRPINSTDMDEDDDIDSIAIRHPAACNANRPGYAAGTALTLSFNVTQLRRQ